VKEHLDDWIKGQAGAGAKVLDESAAPSDLSRGVAARIGLPRFPYLLPDSVSFQPLRPHTSSREVAFGRTTVLLRFGATSDTADDSLRKHRVSIDRISPRLC
jgi:hypothetical protein